MTTVAYKTRTIFFYFCLSLWTIVHSSFCLLAFRLIPQRRRHFLVAKIWSLGAVTLCRFICGVRWHVRGKENIPKNQPCVVISNHQSAWETIFLQTLISPQSQVFKRELLSIPFFGWAIRLANPIAINRESPREAMQHIKKKGLAYLENNISVLIFPEGTRSKDGTLNKFSRGAAGLACVSNVDVLPIAHDAGKFWPSNSWVKTPGTVLVVIGKPIKTEGKEAAEINNIAREWISTTLNSEMNKTS